MARHAVATLLFDPTSDEHELVLQRRRRSWDQLRSWGARDGDRWVGTLGSDLTLTVPSGDGGTTTSGPTG